MRKCSTCPTSTTRSFRGIQGFGKLPVSICRWLVRRINRQDQRANLYNMRTLIIKGEKLWVENLWRFTRPWAVVDTTIVVILRKVKKSWSNANNSQKVAILSSFLLTMCMTHKDGITLINDWSKPDPFRLSFRYYSKLMIICRIGWHRNHKHSVLWMKMCES